MLMPVTQAMIEAALSKIREADYDVPYAVVSVALEAAERASWQPKIAPSGLQMMQPDFASGEKMKLMNDAPCDGREIIAIWLDGRGAEIPVFVFYCPSNRRFIGRNGNLHGAGGYIGWYESPRLLYQTVPSPPERK